MAAPVQEIKTPQGFTVWLVEDHSLPIISANLTFTGSGIAYDPKGKEGRANISASLLLEGAGNRDAKAFNAALEEYAVRLNVGVDDDDIAASFTTLSEHKDVAFSMLSDALARPRFDADAVERARSKMQVLLVEQSQSPHYKLTRGFQESLYGTHSYSRIGIGTKESLDGLTADDFRDYIRRYLTRENVLISVVGDVTAEEISALFDASLGALPERYNPDTAVADVNIPASPDSRVIEHDIPQTIVAFGAEGIRRNDPDYIPAYVFNHALGGGGLNSMLAKEIRVKRGLAYSVNTQIDPKMHAAAWRGMFATRNAQAKAAVAALKEVLAGVEKNGIDPVVLADTKAYLTGSFILNFSSNQEIASFLAVMQRHRLGIDYFDKRNAMVEAVSMEDIKRVSARLIDPSRLRMVMVGKPEL
ncbi:MAG: pitrilysin family protein [Alphaproteobacteria bacterium]|nr:pitrilysin family protein [Alphaproteobacteria bacterium]